MLKKDYISASIKFKEFLNIYTNDFRYNEAKKMLNFCYTQIPYQYFDMGIDLLNDNDYNGALNNFNKAEQIANPELILEIESYKRDIALDMINNIDLNLDFVSFSTSLKKLNNTRSISPYLWSEIDKVEAKILVKKGDILKKINNYLYAIDYYQQALDLDPDLFKDINDKYSGLVISIINDVNNINSIDELKIVKEYLKIIIELKPQYYNSYYPFIVEIDQRLNLYNQTLTKNELKNYIANKRNKEYSILMQNIKLGMNIHEIEAILGSPQSISTDNNYQLWFYQKNSSNTTYFFDKNILIKIN